MKKLFFGFALVAFLLVGIFFSSVASAREPILGDPKFYPSVDPGEANGLKGTEVFNFLIRSIPVPANGEVVCFLADPFLTSKQWTEQPVKQMDLPFLREFFLHFTAEAGMLSRENPTGDPRFNDLASAFGNCYATGGTVEIKDWTHSIPVDIKIGVRVNGTVTYIDPAVSAYAFPVGTPEFLRVTPGNNTGDSIILSVTKVGEDKYRVYFEPDFYEGVEGTLRAEGGPPGEAMENYPILGGSSYPYFEVVDQSVIFFMIYLDADGRSLEYSGGSFYDQNEAVFMVGFSAF